MTSAANSLDNVDLENLMLYHAPDPILTSVLVFYGPVITANSTVSSSRIQAHIVSPCGVKSYPRITVSPTAPIYAPVHHLPREKQGDPECRGLAVCIYKYLSELPDVAKSEVLMLAQGSSQQQLSYDAFTDKHAAKITNKATVVESPHSIIQGLADAYRDKLVPWIDVDLILPSGSITLPKSSNDTSFDDNPLAKYGDYANFVEGLGDSVFLPTSRLRRAPSQPSNASKSKLFATSQKEALRLAMCEVVDTEERYVGKLYELIEIAYEFKGSITMEDEGEALENLFPQSLDEILRLNLEFLDEIRHILENTEQEALDDIASDTIIDASTFKKNASGRKVDPMGILPFARVLLAWFPTFCDPYAAYMRSHRNLNETLNQLLADPYSSLTQKIHETGEKRMRSLLMEPVQRLPRYSLLIDSMTSALPIMHPATKTLLKARDVITEICSFDKDEPIDKTQGLRRLQKIVPEFPVASLPTGRLISAIDAYNLPPPFHPVMPESKSSILLLYADCLILLHKSDGSNISARGLLAYLDKQRPVGNDDDSFPENLSFGFALPVQGMQCAHSSDGRILYLTLPEMPTHALELASTYEGKAARLVEEITKAKVESRFPEALRESGKWSLHSARTSDGKLGILVSLYEEDPSLSNHSSTIRIAFEGTQPAYSHYGIDVSGLISPSDRGGHKMELISITGASSIDNFAPEELSTVLANRLHNLILPLNLPENPRLTASLIQTNYIVTRNLTKHLLEPPKSLKRPKSPSKLLSGIWNSTGKENNESKPTLGNIPPLTAVPEKKSSSPVMSSQPDTPRSATPKLHSRDHSSISSLSKLRIDDPPDPIQALEQTLASYIVCLRSRSGNIVGRILLNRYQADSVEVNELYNVLVEDASKIQAAAEVSVDILFVSFETFLNRAWKETIGPILDDHLLNDMLAKFDSMFPGQFRQYFPQLLLDLSPSNRRALAAIVRLLAELLDASGNDGDRGVLTATFAELLAQGSDAQRCIPLLDRFVDDYDVLFDDVGAVPPFQGPYMPGALWMPGHKATGSTSSNGSSFRKRFGFGPSKESVRMDYSDAREHREMKERDRKENRDTKEGKVSSIIRSLSKGKGLKELKDEDHSLYSKGSFSSKTVLFRSKSTDTDSRFGQLLKPLSKDRLAIQNMFSPAPSEEPVMRPHSSHANLALEAIGEEPSPDALGTIKKPKKKRRSSLSDLTPIHSPATPHLAMFEPQASTPSNQTRNRISIVDPISRPSQSRPTSYIDPRHAQTPPRTSGREKSISPRSALPLPRKGSSKKENQPPPSPTKTIGRANSAPNRTRLELPSSIPTLSPKGTPEPLKWRPKESSGPPSPTRSTRLRMQNPQKLRERLTADRTAFDQSESALQTELSDVSEELRSASPTRSRSTISSKLSSPSSQSNTLLSRLCNLEAKMSAMTTDYQARTSHLEKDIQTSLLVSERRSKQLDALYREASAENVALYERFNLELNKMARQVKGGEGEEGLKGQLDEALQELARTKKENLRLKREIGGLRAQQGGVGWGGFNG